MSDIEGHTDDILELVWTAHVGRRMDSKSTDEN